MSGWWRHRSLPVFKVAVSLRRDVAVQANRGGRNIGPIPYITSPLRPEDGSNATESIAVTDLSTGTAKQSNNSGIVSGCFHALKGQPEISVRDFAPLSGSLAHASGWDRRNLFRDCVQIPQVCHVYRAPFIGGRMLIANCSST